MKEELIAEKIELDKKITELQALRNDVLQQLANLKAEFSVGQRVMNRGCKYEIVAIRPGWTTASTPKYAAKKIKKDGALGLLVYELYSEITPFGQQN